MKAARLDFLVKTGLLKRLRRAGISFVNAAS
jgi:hypothetical protein